MLSNNLYKDLPPHVQVRTLYPRRNPCSSAETSVRKTLACKKQKKNALKHLMRNKGKTSSSDGTLPIMIVHSAVRRNHSTREMQSATAIPSISEVN